ncbi:MAG: hypothetical protein AAF810_14945 [Cyanobacteria bacterium P01_D01_bin.36]
MNNAFNASSTPYAAPVHGHYSSAVVAPTGPASFPPQPMNYQPVIFILSLMAFMSFLRQTH